MSAKSHFLGIWNRPNTSRATKVEAYVNQYLEYLGRVPATGRVGTATCCCCAAAGAAAAVCTMHDGQHKS